MTSESDVDGGKAWVVLAASTFGMLLLCNILYCNSIIHPVLVEQFHVQDSLAAAVGGVSLGLFTFLGPLAGLVAVRWSCRCCVAVGAVLLTGGLVASHFVHSVPLLIFTYSCIVGVGQAFCLNPSISIVGHYFNKYRAVAAGINAAGGSLGMLVSGPLNQFLLDRYGLHGMFLILAAISLHWFPVAMLLGRSPVERRVQTLCSDPPVTKASAHCVEAFHSREKKWTEDVGFLRHYLKSKPFVLYWCSDFFWSLGEVTLLIYLKSFVMARGTSPVDAANLLLAAGISGTVSKILVGLAASHRLIGPWVLHFSLLGIMGVLTLTFPLYGGSYVPQVAFAVCYGLFISSLNSLMTPINAALVGVAHLGLAYGIECMAAGVAYFLGPPLAGLTTSIDPGYSAIFYLSGSSFMMSSFLGVLLFKAAPKTLATLGATATHTSDPCSDPASEKMLGLPLKDTHVAVSNEEAGVPIGKSHSSQTSINRLDKSYSANPSDPEEREFSVVSTGSSNGPKV